MNLNRHILYLSHDGLTDHIGQSQIVPYVLGLAREGFAFTVISLEKTSKKREVETLKTELERYAISWFPLTYHNTPPLLSSSYDLVMMMRKAYSCLAQHDHVIIHCRGFLPTFIGLALKKRFSIPVLFDFRDFWADRRLVSSPFKPVYRLIKRRERWMVINSDHLITLTTKAKQILWNKYLSLCSDRSEEDVTVIPTCVDMNLFDPAIYQNAERSSIRRELKIGDNDLVLGYLGTIHSDYLPEEMFSVYRCLRKIRPSSKFVLVSLSSRDQILTIAKNCGVEESDVVVVAARREDVPKYLSIFDMSVVFVRPDESTAGVFPTKLAELFAFNIPVLANSGLGDMDTIVDPEMNDSVLLANFSDEAIQSALKTILALFSRPTRQGRKFAGAFSLDEGVRKYSRVYKKLLGDVS